MLDVIFIILFLVILLIITVVDLKTLFIPDSCIIALIILALLQHLLKQEGVTTPLLLAACLAAFCMALSEIATRMIGQHALGRGDIKLLFACGLWLDLEKLPLFFIIAGISGCLSGFLWISLGYGRKFPFAPSLALALIGSMWL